MPVPIDIVRQNSRHGAFALNLKVAPAIFESAGEYVVAGARECNETVGAGPARVPEDPDAGSNSKERDENDFFHANGSHYLLPTAADQIKRLPAIRGNSGTLTE